MSSIYSEEKGFNAWKAFMWIIIAVLVITILWVAVATSVWGLRVATAGIYGRGEAIREIQSVEFRLEAYQYFFSQYASIKGLEGKIDELTVQLGQMEPGTREYNYTLSSLAGVKGLRHEAIQKYNADAQRNYTQGQFRDKDLPFQIVDSVYPPEK